MKRYTLPEILALPVLDHGHTDNLIHDADGVRVWVSRMTLADGANCDHEATVERYVNGRWETVERYEPAMTASKGNA